jgi:hypothetical protein
MAHGCSQPEGGPGVARKPYHIARQEHLGDALDDLQSRGRLRWRWDYDSDRRRAIFWVAENTENDLQPLDTAAAENLVLRHYAELDEPWRSVPHPGGEGQRGPVADWIRAAREKQGLPLP